MTAPTFRLFAAHGLTSDGGRLGYRTWEVTDGIGGPLLVSGWALTRAGAERAAAEAAATCVPWVEPEPLAGVCRADLPVLHPLTAMEAYELTCRLALDDVPVTVRVDGPDGGPREVVLWPALALTARQQAHTLVEVRRVTDAPMHWAGA